MTVAVIVNTTNPIEICPILLECKEVRSGLSLPLYQDGAQANLHAGAGGIIKMHKEHDICHKL